MLDSRGFQTARSPYPCLQCRVRGVASPLLILDSVTYILDKICSMSIKACAFNKEAAYHVGAYYAAGTSEKLAIAEVYDIFVSEAASFTATISDIFSKYKLPHVSCDHVVNLWNSYPMQFWQNWLNFVMWYSTTVCGVWAKDHLGNSADFMLLFYCFHVCFFFFLQVRRILKEFNISLPQDKTWNAYENAYNRRAFERI